MAIMIPFTRLSWIFVQPFPWLNDTIAATAVPSNKGMCEPPVSRSRPSPNIEYPSSAIRLTTGMSDIPRPGTARSLFCIDNVTWSNKVLKIFFLLHNVNQKRHFIRHK